MSNTEGLGPLPRIHEREKPVREAECELRQAILDVEKKHDLTEAELLRVVNGVCSETIGSIAKYHIRFERHGDTDTPGGWAKE
jgi:hypothetical protein